MNVEFAFIECPTRLDPDRAFVVSGHRLTSKKLDVFPFEFGVSLFLDERSQKLLGMETVTVSETELVTDCVDTPVSESLPETTTDGRFLRITPYLTLMDLKRMNTADLLAVAQHAERAQKVRKFESHWERISEWVAELRGTELPPVGSQLELFERA